MGTTKIFYLKILEEGLYGRSSTKDPYLCILVERLPAKAPLRILYY